MGRHELWTALYAGLLFTVLGLVAWATGVPFVSPSLGPSVFVLAHDRRGEGITATGSSAVTPSASSRACSRTRCSGRAPS